jgi:2-keto-4-pentenoate hydratase/2-oxohepta-3-ene-1,7-dioic acid hydratase in catechol pathway
MRFLMFRAGHEHRLGAQRGDEVVDLRDALRKTGCEPNDERDAWFADLESLIRAGDAAQRAAAELVGQEDVARMASRPLAGLELDAPLYPPIILCTGQNYRDHIDEKEMAVPADMEFFMKAPLAIQRPDGPIRLRQHITQKLDYEVELAIVIGTAAADVEVSDALDHVFGYTIMNDVTARDRQVLGREANGKLKIDLIRSKNFATAAPLGPVIVTKDEIAEPQNLRVRCLVNGEVRQDSSTRYMVFDVAQIVSFMSKIFELEPGTIISTGTPGGTAWGRDASLGGTRGEGVAPEDAGYLRPGDVVTCEIESIGSLSNTVVAA